MSSIPGVHLLGNENPDSLAGSVGNDTLTGGGEVDTLQGFDCDDRISGNSGGDRGFGNRGRDTLYGGVGDDTLHGGRQDDTLYGEGGDDWLLGDRDDDLVLGDSGRDWMFGGSGMDSLFGNTDSDSLYGGKGNDCLFGGQGDDRLFGDLDDDTLSGDRGADTMTGGDGRDVFAIGFNTGGTTLADADIITDFTPGEDAILLLGNLTFDALNIVAGTGENAGNAIVQNRLTGEFLAVLQGVESTAIDRENFLFQPPAPPLEIAEISPTSGEEMVAPTREAIVRFTRRVDPTSFDDPNAFYLIANGERVPGRVVVSRTEQFATFFPDNPLPASTGVRVVVDGDKIRGRDGTLLSAIDEAAIVATDFRTLPLTQIPDTSVEGYLFDSYNRNPDGSNRPIVGATLTVDGLPDVRAVTDSQGYFKLENVPAPEFFVRIDGSTAINAPPGTQYPTLGKPFHSVPGQTVGLTMDGEAFDIFLPPMALGDIQSLSPTKTTDIGFGLSATAQLVASFPDIDPEVWNLTQVTFFPNGAIDDRGNRATAATIIPVPPDRLPGPLPPGIDPQLVISVQAGNGNNLNAAGGATNFDVPAPLEFPNLEGLSPGEQSLFWAFDHDAGRWEVVGTGTVSADGRMVVSDAGVGLQAPGWVFVQPGVIINVSPDIHLDDAFWRITYGGFELHGQMDGSSQISTVLPENRRFSLTIYDRRGERLGSFDGQTGVSGSILDIQDIEFVSTDGLPDTDGEGLVDAAERVIGTLPDNPDTDADGISDAAEIDGGLNPNDNNPFPTAIIASLPLQGEAKAIVVEGSPDDPTRQTAYLATGSHGLAIVDVTQFDLPIVLGQLNLPGTAIDVAIDANLQIAAVASHTGKLHFVDVADPIQPQLLQTVDVEASYVEVSGGLAYAATGNEIVLVDLATGDILDRRQYAGGNIDDLAIADGFLYTISRSGISPQTVHKIELTGNILTAPIDSFVVEDRPTFGRLHIAAGGGFVYVGAIDDNFTNQIPGVTILQDTESGMVLVGPPFGLTAFDVAPNGSDLLLFTGANTFGPLGGGVGLLDVSDPTRTDRFLTSFTTPDGALDIAIASGIAFVASNTAGLQVINYLPFDSQGQAPTVAIDSPVVDADPDTPGVQVVENTLVPVSAQVTDDVQVRNVELLFNGEVVRNDVSFPFDVSAFAPDFTEVGETFTIQVRATDTGGNSTLSNVLEFELLEDIFGPVVIRSFPEPGGVGFSSAPINISFNKPLDTDLVNLSGITLTNLGEDGVLGGGDDIPVVLDRVEVSADRRLTVFPEDALDFDNHRLVLDPSVIVDRSGNPLAEPFELEFTSTEPVSVGVTQGLVVENAVSAGSGAASFGEFTVARQGNIGDLTVNFEIDAIDGSDTLTDATFGEDYILTDADGVPLESDRITIPDGENAATILVEPIDDTLGEGAEGVKLKFLDGVDYTIVSTTGTGGGFGTDGFVAPLDSGVTIWDNEPQVSLFTNDFFADETGANPGGFTVSRSAFGGDATGSLTANFDILTDLGTDSAATPGVDYILTDTDGNPLPGNSITFADGEFSVVIGVNPIDDAPLDDPNEVVRLQLVADPEMSYFVNSFSSTSDIVIL